MEIGAAFWAWLRRTQFRARSAAGRQRTTARLALGRWLPVLIGFGLAAASLYADSYVLSALCLAPPLQTAGLATPVFAAVVGLSGLLTLAVTVSAGPLESALGRFPASVGAPLLEDEARDGLLALLLSTLTLALCLLVVSATGLAIPLTGTALATLFAVATLATLVGYVRWRGTLRRPRSLAWHLANQTNGWFLAASRRPRRDEGVGVAPELRRLYSDNFARLAQMCRSLLQEDEEEAGEILGALSYTVVVYLPRKRRLASESDWFPLREEGAAGYAPLLEPLYDKLVLGMPSSTVRDRLWLERMAARAWEDLLEEAEEVEASGFCRAWTTTLKLLLRFAFDEQEFGAFERFLGTASAGARRLQELPDLAGLVSVPTSVIQDLEFEGLRASQAEQVLASGRSLTVKNLLRAGVGTELIEILLEVGGRLRNQSRIEQDPSYRTPASAVTRLVEARAEGRQEELHRKFLPMAIALSSELSLAAEAGGHWETLASLVSGNLAAVDSLLMRRRSSTARELLEATLAPFETALESADLTAEYKRRLAEGMRAPWLRALYSDKADILELAGPALAKALAELAGSDPRARHDLIALLAIAEIARRRRTNRIPLDALLSGIGAAGIAPAVFAREALGAAAGSPFGRLLPMGEYARYAEWARPLANRLLDLDPTARSLLNSLLPPAGGGGASP